MRITVRMLEAHYNAIPTLLEYIERQAKNDPSATRTLKKFKKELKKERNIIDPSEAVFGFAAVLAKLNPSEYFGVSEQPKRIAKIAGAFCDANNLGAPAPGYAGRLIKTKVPEESRIIKLH